MLYLGHFTWDAGEPTEHPFGWFTMLCEAEDVEDASEIFEELIVYLKESSDTLEDVALVYIEDIIEVRKLPARGVLGHFSKTLDPLGTVSTSLPGVPEEACVPYIWRYTGGEEIDEDESHDGSALDEAEDVIPFVDFTEGEEEEVRP